MSQSLFDDSPDELASLTADHPVVGLPELDHYDSLIIDFETTGVKWYRGDVPVGVGWWLPDGRHGYSAWAHRGGGNSTDAATAKRWLCDIKRKKLTNAAILFDMHMARNFGVDLADGDNTFGDVQHYAALLDDHRRHFNQALLCQDFLTDEEKVTVVDGHVLVAERMADYHASMVAPRAIGDVRQVAKLVDVMWPRLTAENLHRVRALEESIIPAVCEMERNALRIDMDLLEQWCHDVEQEYLRCLYFVAREVGFQVSPGKTATVKRLFEKLNIPITEFTEKGAPSFTDAVLYAHRDVHPAIAKLYRAAKLEDLLSKALQKFKKAVHPTDRLLRFALHQLRSDDGGTVTGRFSSAALQKGDPESGVNSQQIMTAEKQRVVYGEDCEWIIERLIIAEEDETLVASDAKQIEYRIFASETGSPNLIEAYRLNPNLSFHHHTWEMIKPFKPDQTYKAQKNMNFMKIYGGGLAKLALMLGHITDKELAKLQAEYPRGVPHRHPRLQEAAKVQAIYDRELPEVGPLLDKYSALAEKQGFVTTVTGRRMRFPRHLLSNPYYHPRYFKALNGVIQGGAADVMKQKLKELYDARKSLGLRMRCTIHDAFKGGVGRDDLTAARGVDAILNAQSFPEFKVPILWDTKIGRNWADMQELPSGA